MWRFESTHKRGSTEFLETAMERVRSDERLQKRAEATINAVRSEPLFACLFACPQSPVFHAEGPFVEDHLRLILMSLYAVLEEKFHLIDVEEFRRMKGFEGEIDELEETIKEKAASLETYTLCHDLGKPATIWFEARAGSSGDRLGFRQPLSHAWVDEETAQRKASMKKYTELYQAFFADNKDVKPEALQMEFFSAYQIDIHYPGHAPAIAHPDLRSLFERTAAARRLSVDDQQDLFFLVTCHMDAFQSFQEANPSAYDRFAAYTPARQIARQARGRDADDFLDLFLAAVFLDMVCGSRRGSAHGAWHDPSVVVHFLEAERLRAPWKREQREKQRMEEAKKEERRRLRDVGLDGNTLQKLLGMKPGFQFGQLLVAIHTAARGETDLPSSLRPEAREELERRVLAFQSKILLDRNSGPS